MAIKNEMSLEELAKMELNKFDEENNKPENDRIKLQIASLSVVALATLISASTGLIMGIRGNDEKTDHLVHQCFLDKFFGLKHQEKMINKQYSDEVIATNLTENDDYEVLEVYYIDDDNSKRLIKSFYQKK